MTARAKRLIPVFLFIFSSTYYYLLSAKIFTWIYTTVDAGDWLSLLHWWYVPHRFGKPLIILFIRFLSLFPGGDVLKLTVAMAVIPGAITVAFTYLIALRLTGKIRLALAAAAVLMGAVLFTTQSGVIEQYTFTAMLFTIAFWFHIKGNRVGTFAFLGLATATHIVGAVFLVIWVIAYWHERKEWLKVSWVYVVTGILPYSLIFILMANPDVPRLHTGGLSIKALAEYFLSGDAISAPLSLVAVPQRLLDVFRVVLMTLGIAIVPFIVGIRKLGRQEKFVLALIGFTAWFCIASLYPSVWKYFCFVLPIIAAYVAVGLSKMARWHTVAVVVCAFLLIGMNSVYYNSDMIARENPKASDYYEAVWALPDGSAVVTSRGGAYGFTLHYILSEGKDIIPLEQYNPYDMGTYELRPNDQRYEDCLEWLERTYGIEGDDMFEIIEYARAQGIEIYYGSPLGSTWASMITTEDPDVVPGKIVSINKTPDFSSEVIYEQGS